MRPGVKMRCIAAALHDWLDSGAASTAAKKPSAWWLARSAVVVIDPPRDRGRVVWPKPE